MSYKQSEIAILKACALKQFNGEDFFIVKEEIDGDMEIIKAYEGTEEEAKNQYKDYVSEQEDEEVEAADYDDFETWCSENLTELDPIDDDEERERHIVLTDDEADEKAGDYIKDSLWAFNASFLAGETGIDQDVFEAIQANGKCEDNNNAIESCIDDIDSFIEAAIRADGRGHFLSLYDGNENEETVEGETFYIYRID